MILSQNQINNIPLLLRAMPQWVTWRYEKRKGQDKPTKVPYNPATGRRASAGQPDTWVDFDTAVNAQGYDGVGYEFNDMGLIGVDIDHCINLETGEVSPAALRVVGLLNSYTEFSPSGTGLHIFVYGNIPAKGRKDPASGIEMYRDVRFLTMTGNPFMRVKPIERRDREIMQLYDELFPDKPQEMPTQQPASPTLDDGKLLEIAGKASNGEKFRRLYSGDTGGYPSHSEADMALCNYLAFYTGKDPAQMDRLFRASGLMRPKWDEKHGSKTYGASTIEDAIGHTVDTFGSKQAAAEDFAPVTLPQGWEPPIPFEVVKVPPFPVHCLPAPMADYAKAVAEELQVSVDLAAVAILAIVAIGVQNRFIINPKPGWIEQLNLYATTIALPSDRKTPVLKSVSQPIYDYMREENIRRAPEIERYRIQKRMLEKAITGMIERNGKTGTKNRATTEEILAKQRELAELEAVNPLRLLADDVTPEALVSLMADNGGCMAVISAEGGIFEIVSGLYNSKVNVDVFLKAYSGDPIMVDRKGRASENITHPRLTMMLSVQPVVISEIMKNRTLKGRGLLARFLYSYPNSKVGSRNYDSRPVLDVLREQYRRVIYNLLSIPEGNIQAIHLSEEAQEESRNFANALEPRLKGDLFEINDWAGKYHGQVMRIAGLLHCIIHQEAAAQELLQGGTMRAAQEIGEYFLEHAKAVFLTVSGAEIDDAKYILRRLNETKHVAVISKRELLRRCRKFKNNDDLSPGLTILCDCGYLREIETEPHRGGKQSQYTKYEINPASYDKNDNEQL